MEVLRLENLSKFYTSENAVVMGLSGIHLSFSIGEFVALTGESGSGKSTLAHVLGGILPYESGELYVCGQPTSHYDTSDWAAYRRDMISFISQSYGILPGNTVSENVENALRLSGLSKEEARQRTDAILEEVELTEFKRRKAGKLSSGQKQRLSIARALAKPSKILIADEPTGNLDRENSDKIISLLKKAAKEKLVILITHEFEEAKDVATRRIILSDGEVVTDAPLRPKEEVAQAPKKEEKTKKKEKKTAPLFPYICYLSTKAHPIFSAVFCLLLTVTTLITFVFLGNFVIALDDTSTRIYDSKAFFCGTPERLVVMRTEGKVFSEEDFSTILGIKYVESVDRFGPVADLIYHYKEGIDHVIRQEIQTGPNYDPISNPNDYAVVPVVELFDHDYQFVKTLPLSYEAEISVGRKAENPYEVVSSDPDYQVGDTVTVYIQNPKGWNIGEYLKLQLEVVGETDFGEGLYISDTLANALLSPIVPSTNTKPFASWNVGYVFLPYEKGMFPLQEGGNPEVVLTEEDFIFYANKGMPEGTSIRIKNAAGETEVITCKELHTAPMSRLILVSKELFDTLFQDTTAQISVYTQDYSYTERVVNALKEEGYMPISPYQLGATRINEQLKQERVMTLGICAATFAVATILQFIVLFILFGSLHEYFKLMANTGLTAGTACLSVSAILIGLTVVGELLGGGMIFLLNRLGIQRVVNIFKYLDTPVLIVLFLLHFAMAILSLLGILLRTKHFVFGKNKAKYDIDFREMEEVL